MTGLKESETSPEAYVDMHNMNTHTLPQANKWTKCPMNNKQRVSKRILSGPEE